MHTRQQRNKPATNSLQPSVDRLEDESIDGVVLRHEPIRVELLHLALVPAGTERLVAIAHPDLDVHDIVPLRPSCIHKSSILGDYRSRQKTFLVVINALHEHEIARLHGFAIVVLDR